jgi:PAS domain S-box-containing protein
VPFQTVGRLWAIHFTPTKKYFLAQRRWQTWSVLAAGLFFTGLLGAFLLAVTGHDAKLQAINTELNKEITDRRTAEQEVSKLAAIVEYSDDSIVGTTLDGIITSWNKGAEMLYGYSPEEVKDRHISLLYPPGRLDELTVLRESIKQGKPVAQHETVRVTKGGARVDVSLTLSAIRDSTGKITGVASVTRDISERKRAEAELEQHREDVAHRLHDSVIQSLTAISLHLELVRREVTENPEAATQRLGKIDRVVAEEQQNLRSFVRELKGVGLVAPGQFGETAGLEALIDRLETQWGVNLSLQLSQEVMPIPKNIAFDLAYIIQEGVANAVRHGHASKVNVIVGKENADLTISILDNGKGFPFHGYYDTATLDINGAGPVTLKSRIASLKGTLSIRSAESGASLEIRVPFWQEGTSNGNQTRNRG